MAGFLHEMAQGSHARARAALAACPEARLLAQALASAAPPPLRLDASGFDLIAELKLRSPAAGRLQGPGTDVPARVQAYADAGAAAVSVLTEPSRFDGALAHLEAAAAALAPAAVPVMRKDFLVAPCQLMEARIAGAGGVLLILRMLSPEDLSALLACARELQLFVLLEAFDAADIERLHAVAGAAGGPGVLAGVNCRDLDTLQVVPGRLTELFGRLPAHLPRIAESGVASGADAARMAACGYEGALVGSALMQGSDPGQLARAMLREARAVKTCG